MNIIDCYKLKIKNKKIILICILLLGLFLRIYKAPDFFLYNHDSDLAGWFVRDVVENKHIRLIGQETSTQGIFIGPLYYYLLIPFYLIFNLDPIGGVFLVTILGMFTIWSFYFVFKKVFNNNTGLVAAFIYSVSFYSIFNDREVVPTMPVVLWTVWYFYSLNLLLKGEHTKGLVFSGILIGLIWHLNFALVLLVPLILLSLYLSKMPIRLKNLLYGIVALLLTSLPLILFELRHNLSQVNWFIRAITAKDQHDVFSGVAKLFRVLSLTGKNITGIMWGTLMPVRYEHLLLIFLVIFAIVVRKKLITRQIGVIMSAWFLLYIIFFSSYSKIVSEYYLNGLTLLWILILSVSVSALLERRKFKRVGLSILLIFSLINIYRFFTLQPNRSGYIEKRGIVRLIKEDALKNEYHCIAISYIADPGYDCGYRYFFWLEKMHVNRPESGSPVYTIVYPMKPIFEHDISFGAIGLIYPDYSRYTMDEVEISCSGDNSNLTDPMFGFTN